MHASHAFPGKSLLPWALSLLVPSVAFAVPEIVSVKVDQDTFVSSAEPTGDFSLFGAVMIATPTATQPRTMLTLLSFDTASIRSAFDTRFGAGAWSVTSVELKVGSNFATAGVQPNNARFNVIAPGDFVIDWLGNDAWDDAAVNWNTLPSVIAAGGSTSLGTFHWNADGLVNPPGNPQYTNWSLTLAPALTADIASGGVVSLLGKPADTPVGYLFNQQTRVGAEPYLVVTADITPVPEPGTVALCLMGLLGIVARVLGERRRTASTPRALGASA